MREFNGAYFKFTLSSKNIARAGFSKRANLLLIENDDKSSGLVARFCNKDNALLQDQLFVKESLHVPLV